MRTIPIAVMCLFCMLGCVGEDAKSAEKNAAATLLVDVLEVLPHDASRYTQGLVIDGDHFLESTGRYAQSALFETDVRSDRVLRSTRLPDSVFAEGIALFNHRIHLLTWREQRGFVFTRDFTLEREWRYDGEGWGLTSDGQQLIRSDGSSRLVFLDPVSHQPRREIEVRDGGTPVERLNELEMARGWILANIWFSDRVAVIRPEDGRVVAWLDLAALRARLPAGNKAEALNGLAYDAARDVLYATGKLWPSTFALRVYWPAATAAQ